MNIFQLLTILVVAQTVCRIHCLSEKFMKNLLLVFTLLCSVNVSNCDEPERFDLKLVNYQKSGFKQKISLRYTEEVSEINLSLVNPQKIFNNNFTSEEIEMQASLTIHKYDRNQLMAEAEVVFSKSELILPEGNREYLFLKNVPYSVKIHGEETKIFLGDKEIKYKKQVELITKMCSISFEKGWLWEKNIAIGETKKETNPIVENLKFDKQINEDLYTLNSISFNESLGEKIANATYETIFRLETVIDKTIFIAIVQSKNTSEFSLEKGKLISEVLDTLEVTESKINAPDTSNEKSFKKVYSVKKRFVLKYF